MKVSTHNRETFAVFGIALAARLLYIAQIRGLPTFDVPLVDGPNYFRMARAVAGGALLGGSEVFWQPPFYPYFLAAVMRLLGDRMTTIYAVQAILGALSCVLVVALGRRLFAGRAALAAGLIVALYGPLIYFDAQPLVPVTHLFLVLAGLLALLRAADPRDSGPAAPGRRDAGGAGLLWGLAATATPNILAAVPAAAVWLGRRRRSISLAGLLVAGVAAPVGCVAARNLLVARDPVLISANGGINFFIGNNADYDRTIRLRPGGEFARLAQEPENLGIVKASARSRWFAARGRAWLLADPRGALSLYLRKIRDLLAGREIPRNQDMYGARHGSSLLSILLWRHGVSFPFGLVAPLALAGCCGLARGDDAGEDGVRRAGRRLLLLYGGFYAVSILLFFPTDRYRLPLVPVAALFAGRAIAALPAAWRRPRFAAVLLAGLVLFNLDAGRAAETFPEEEALNRAYALRMKGRLDEARDAYLQARTIQPNRIDPYNALASMAAEQGRWDEAVARYGELLALAPDFADVRRSLGEAYAALGRTEDARREWRAAVALAPGAGLALADLCTSYLDEGAVLLAEPFCERAVTVRPDLPETHLAMGLLSRAMRRRDRARAELTEALRLFPPDNPGAKRTSEILDRMRRRDAALESASPAP